MPAIQTFTASRNATWAPTLVYPYPGPQLPAIDHIAMELRLYPGAPGGPLLAIGAIPVTDALAGGTVGQANEVRWLTLSPGLLPADLATMPSSGEIGNPVTFAFDILITYADGIKEILSSGSFVLNPGVTTV